jgi:uncharacterized protein (DUF433 family)
MAANILNIQEIVSDPKVRGGRPSIKGTGLTVMNVVLVHTTGEKLSFEDIADHYHLSLGQVHAAMSYYYLHHEALDAQLEQEMAETEELLAVLRKQGRLLE